MNLKAGFWWIAAVLAALALGAGVWVGKSNLVDKSAEGQPATPLLGITLPDPDGKDQAIGQWKGKVLVVNFWATWCAPCREEMPMFMRVQDAQRAKGVQFVGIAVDNADKVRQYAADLKLNYPTLIGGFGAMELSKTLGNSVMALPFTVIVDRSGKVAHTQLGPLKEDQLQSILRQLT
ncbi:MAG TPA: TlpA disulfide reductase family protein [Casimicrobiaceae bacterium]|jgi:thiol-disulfide isomerase/thioredoxin